MRLDLDAWGNKNKDVVLKVFPNKKNVADVCMLANRGPIFLCVFGSFENSFSVFCCLGDRLRKTLTCAVAQHDVLRISCDFEATGPSGEPGVEELLVALRSNVSSRFCCLDVCWMLAGWQGGMVVGKVARWCHA